MPDAKWINAAKRARAEITARVRAHVQLSKLTIGELGEQTGWGYMRAMRILNGKTYLGAEDMEALSRVLKTPVADLYRWPRDRDSRAAERAWREANPS